MARKKSPVLFATLHTHKHRKKFSIIKTWFT